MIKYTLIENSISAENDACYAIVSAPGTKNLEDIITLMTEEGSGLTRPQALAYFEKLTESVKYYTSHGYCINTPLFRLRPTICGTFKGKEDKFDPERHQIKVRGSEGQCLRDMPTQVSKIIKINNSLQSPVLYTFTDIQTENRNETITSMGLGVLRGKRLRFDTKDTQLGLFFVPITTPKNSVRVDLYSGVKPSEIHFQIPELQAGEYSLIVQTLSPNGKINLSGDLGTILRVY